MKGVNNILRQSANNRIQLTVISVIFFAGAKKLPLITSADAGVIPQAIKVRARTFIAWAVGPIFVSQSKLHTNKG